MSNHSVKSFTRLELTVEVVKTKEVNGLEMGVLNDGTPFLTERGLANLCGVPQAEIAAWTTMTTQNQSGFWESKIAGLLNVHGFEGDKIFFKTFFNDQPVNGYPDIVCMAFLEYYAFEAGEQCVVSARNNFRVLARHSLRNFVYRATGYDPVNQLLNSWRHFHDRLLLNPPPVGYFSVFRETADIVIAAIRQGLIVDHHTVPDISVGRIWSNHWNTSNLNQQYGNRAKFPHVYPDYFPQAQANDVIEAFIYPFAALGEFRQWLQMEYLPNKFPSYLATKARQGAIPATCVQPLIAALKPMQADQLRELRA